MSSYVVRYGGMRILGVFDPPGSQQFQRNTQVIVRTERGLEAGEVLCSATEESVGRIKDPARGQILRRMTADDANEISRIHDQEKDEFGVCLKCIRNT